MKVVITKQGLTYCGTNPTKHNSGQKWCGGFLFLFFMTPTFHLNQQNTKKKKTQTSVVNCFQLKLAKTGNLMLLDDLIKVSSLIYICLYRSVYLH